MFTPPEGGGGWLSKFGSMMQNPQVLQMLLGGGQGLASGQGMQGFGATGMQQLQSQQFMKLLAKMLGGEGVPPGATVKHSDKGTTLDVPSGFFKDVISGNTLYNAPQSGGTNTSPAATPPTPPPDTSAQLMNMFGGGYPNPFGPGQLNFSAADLAGLAPEHISKALEFKFGQTEMAQKSAAQLLDAMYKGSLMDYYAAQTKADEARLGIAEMAEERQWTELMRSAPVPVPGLGELTLDEWKSLPPDTQAYSYYVFDAIKNNQPRLTYNAWRNQVDPASLEKTLDRAMKDPEFKNMLFEYAERGATRITTGEKLEEKAAISKLQGRDYFNDPSWRDDISKYVQSEDVQIKLWNLERDPAKRAILAISEEISRIKFKIAAGGGTIVDTKTNADKSQIIWVVQWPDIRDSSGKVLMKGTEESIVYAVK